MNFKFIDTIDFSSCKELRKNRLFYNPVKREYYKIWEEGKVLWNRKIGDLFLTALNTGFYNNITEIKSVLLSDNGSCVGYAMDEYDCPLNDKDGIIRGKVRRHKNKHGFNIFDNAFLQDEKYRVFFNTLLENTKETGYFFYDLVQSNVADLGDKYIIIDIESVSHIRDLYKIPKYHRECLPEDYQNFLQELYESRVGIPDSGIDMSLIQQAWDIPTGGMDRKPYCSVNINGRYFDGERAWELRWSQFKDLLWKDKKILDLGTCMGLVPAYLLKYNKLNSATAIDFNPHHIQATDLVRRAFRIPADKMRIIPLDLENSNYEEILGYDYDAVFCLSFLRWIKDKNRLLRYLSKFQNVVFEAHDLDGDIVSIFKEFGFKNHKILGESRIGRSFDEKKKRSMYCFYNY